MGLSIHGGRIDHLRLFLTLNVALFIFSFGCEANAIPQLTILHSLVAGTDGSAPEAGLIEGTDGNFYGTTTTTGPSGNGTVFKMTPTGTVTVLHAFSGGTTDGANPYAGVIQARDGNFYGTTISGGSAGLGTVFKITPSGVETILHSFGGPTGDGSIPYGGLVQGISPDDNLYGTTKAGGANTYYGTVFSITSSGTENILHSFSGTDGINPYASLIEVPTTGILYGVTEYGGVNNGSSGTAFQITTAGSYTLLHSFADGSVINDGFEPYAPLLLGKDGNFYGTTQNGGGYHSGTIFKMTPGGTETILHSFQPNSSDGIVSWSGLIQENDGNFYGTTQLGGANGSGTVFEMTPTGVVAILHNFADSSVPNDGVYPYGGLILYGNTLLGTTLTSALNSGGTIFQIAPPATGLIHFSQWETNYGVSNLPTDTSFGDWTPYLLKYFCDIDPTVPMSTRAGLPLVGLDSTSNPGTTYLTLTYRQAAYETGVTPNIQSSFDLQSWTTVSSPPPVQIGIDWNTGDFTMEAEIPITNRLQFIRLDLVLTSP